MQTAFNLENRSFLACFKAVVLQFVANVVCLILAGMEVLNRAIESIMHSRDRDEWEPIVIHVSDTVLSLWRGEVRQETCRHTC